MCVRERGEIPRLGVGYQKFNIYSRLKEKEGVVRALLDAPKVYINSNQYGLVFGVL